MSNNDQKPAPHKPKKTEEILEKSLEDSFPASDPSSVTRAPADKRETQTPPPKTTPSSTTQDASKTKPSAEEE